MPMKVFGRIIAKYKRLKKKNRNIVLIASLTSILLLVGIWAVLFSRHSKTNFDQQLSSNQSAVTNIENAPAMEAKLSYEEGTVEYKDDKGSWLDPAKNQELSVNYGVRTLGSSSKAIIELADGSEIRLDANTEILFNSLTESRVAITQNGGYAYNRVVSSTDRIYVISTKDAQYQSEGTAFMTVYSGDEQSVEVYQGNISETNYDAKISDGEKFIAKSKVDPSKTRNKEKLDIETIKKNEFVMWNRQQDSSKDKFKSLLGFLSDIDGPSIEISEPTAGSTIEFESDSTIGTVDIKGKTEKGATLTVQSKSTSGSSPIPVEVNADDGSFDTGLISAPFGNSVFELVATDKVGNKTALNVTYNLKKKSATSQKGIVLEIDDSDTDKLKLSWGLVGITAPDGLKLLYQKGSSPQYPDDIKETIAGTKTTLSIDKSSFSSGKTYYFVICRYNKSSDTCDILSNEVEIKF